MNVKSVFNKKAAAVVGVVAIAATAGTGASVAAKQITTNQIKDGTIQTKDLTKNNFAKFTSTEAVFNAETPISANPAYAGARVVDVNANGTTPLVTLVLDKGTYKLSGTAQFWHIGGGVPGGAGDNGEASPTDIGVVTVPGLQTGFAQQVTGDIPNGGVNPAQVTLNGTIKITANNTPVVISGNFTANGTGQAGVSVSATRYEYVKLFKGGQPTS